MNQKLSLSLNHLQHFVAIAEHGSLRAAAERLGLSQAAVSKSLRNLEAALDTRLVQRNARGANLTLAGEVFLSRARLIENEISRTTDEIRAMSGSRAEHVTIGASAIPSILLIPKAIARLRAEHPGVGLDLVGGMPSVLLQRLTDGSLDFVVGPRPTEPIPESISSTPLLKLRVGIVVRKGHPLEWSNSLEDFADAQWVVSSNSSYAKEKIQSIFRGQDLRNRTPYIRVDSLFALLSFIRNTDFVGIVPSIDRSADLYGNDVTVLKITEMDFHEEYQLFLRRNSRRSAVSISLMALLHKEARLYKNATRN